MSENLSPIAEELIKSLIRLTDEGKVSWACTSIGRKFGPIYACNASIKEEVMITSYGTFHGSRAFEMYTRPKYSSPHGLFILEPVLVVTTFHKEKIKKFFGEKTIERTEHQIIKNSEAENKKHAFMAQGAKKTK